MIDPAMQRGSMRDRLGIRRGREGGAAIVEFAILAPLLVILLLGIVEFGWLFGQYNAVRHGAREAGRYAAVDGGADSPIVTNNIRTTACDAIEGQGAGISELRVGVAFSGSGKIGDDLVVNVEADVDGLTNLPLISSFLPATLQSNATFRIEQDATWTSDPDTSPSDGLPDAVACP